MKTDVSGDNTPQRRSNPKVAQSWPIKARQVAVGAVATLRGVARSASGIDGHAKSLNAITEQALEDLRKGDYESVKAALEAIRNATATQRHASLDVFRDTQMVAQQIERALDGKYE